VGAGREDLEGTHQLIRVKRLGEYRGSAHSAGDLVSKRHPAQDDDSHRPLRAPPILSRELIPAHASAKVEVDQHQVRIEAQFVGDLEGLLAGTRHPDGELLAKGRGDGGESVGVVLNDEDAGHLGQVVCERNKDRDSRTARVSRPGFEPGTKGLKVPCSTVELAARRSASSLGGRARANAAPGPTG